MSDLFLKNEKGGANSGRSGQRGNGRKKHHGTSKMETLTEQLAKSWSYHERAKEEGY